MALDGTVIAAMAQELRGCIVGGRISKIAQPETDELMLTIKNERKNYRLLISAGASLPLIYLTEENKPAPMTAPNFCMLLRKHLGGGKILSVTQPGLERILRFEIEHLNELGDLCKKNLIVEIMGKHSNIIFCNDNDTIIDSIKHISLQVSSVREVLPGRPYFIPETQNKLDPLTVTCGDFRETLKSKPIALSKAIYSSFTGISPQLAEEMCHRASMESDRSAGSFSDDELLHLYRQFEDMMEIIKKGDFKPQIVCRDAVPADFAVIPLTLYADSEKEMFPTVSAMLENYYAMKNTVTRIRQRSVDLRKIVQNALDRNCKKYDLQLKQLKDSDKREKYRIYGELLNTYGYSLEPGAKSLTALNYYTNEEITIPLDNTLTALENSQKYFDKYGKMKRTHEALSSLIKETQEEIEHLESIQASLDFALSEADLIQIKEELIQYGYMKRRGTGKREKITSKPFHYVSADGYDMYVGKNNFQNEELTFKVATGNDWWFHAKGCPGSHVIVKANNTMPPDGTFEEAARLAAYYSKNRNSGKVDIDYIEKKQVKKVPGAKPGFVIYHTNYSMTIDPDISKIKQLS